MQTPEKQTGKSVTVNKEDKMEFQTKYPIHGTIFRKYQRRNRKQIKCGSLSPATPITTFNVNSLKTSIKKQMYINLKQLLKSRNCQM